jgi:hypothetical protein
VNDQLRALIIEAKAVFTAPATIVLGATNPFELPRTLGIYALVYSIEIFPKEVASYFTIVDLKLCPIIGKEFL